MSFRFPHDPLDYIEGDRALDSLRRYAKDFPGIHFGSIADADPHRITEKDLLAVTMLNVRVPARTAWWCLHSGSHEVRALLEEIPTSTEALWSEPDPLRHDGPA
jgi:hypothetical protein